MINSSQKNYKNNEAFFSLIYLFLTTFTPHTSNYPYMITPNFKFLFLFLFCYWTSFAQPKVDSLKRELYQNHSDSSTLSIYGLIGDDFYYNGKNDSAIYYWEIAKDFALNSKKKELSEIQKFVIDKKLSVIYNDLAYLNVEKGNFDKAVNYFHECLLLKQNINDLLGEINTYTNLGYLYIKKRDLDSARFFNQTAYQLAKINKLDKTVATSAAQLGLIYTKIGALEEGLNYLNESLNYFKSTNDTLGLAKTYNNIAKSYEKLNDDNTALEFYFKSLALKISLNDKKSTATAYNNIGACYLKINELELAIKYNNKALSIFKETNDNIGLATTLNNIGFIHYKMKEYDEALGYYEQSLAIREKISDVEGIAYSLLNISKIHSIDENYNKALTLLNKANEIALEIKNIGLLSDCALQLSLNNEKLKNYETALAYFKKHTLYSNKLNSNSNRNKATLLNVMIKVKQQNYIDSLSLVLKNKNNKNSWKQELKKSSFMIDKRIVYIFLLFLGGITSYYFFSKRKK